MGHVVPALRRSVSLVADVPGLVPALAALFFVAAIAGAIVQTILGIVPLIGPLLGLAYALVARAVVSAVGLGAVATAAREGRLGLDGGPDGIVDDAVPLAGAFALVGAAGVALLIVGVVAAVVVAGLGSAGGSPVGPGTPDAGLGAAAVGLILAGALAAVLVGVVVQFLDVAVVLGNAGALDAFRTAWAIITRAPLSVAGYTVVRALLVSVPIVVAFGAAFALALGPSALLAAGGVYGGAGAGAGAGSAGAPNPDALVGALAGSLLLGVAMLLLVTFVLVPIVRAVSTVYHAVFFASLDADLDLPPREGTAATARSGPGAESESESGAVDD